MPDIVEDIEKQIQKLGGFAPSSFQKMPPGSESQAIERSKALLTDAHATIVKQNARIEQLSGKPLVCATVIRVLGEGDKKRLTIACEGRFLDVAYPVGTAVKLGDSVKVTADTFQIVDVVPPVKAGNVGVFLEALGDDLAKVMVSSATRIVYRTSLEKTPEEGDGILLDNSGTVILLNLGNDDSRYSLEENPNVLWSDVCGQDEAKAALQEAIIGPKRDAKLFKAYGKKRIKGILLLGPHGCGKTMLGQAAATEICAQYGAENLASGYIYVKGAEVLDKYLGVAEAAIRGMFLRGRRHMKKHGYPALIFLDELEALVPKRGSGVSSDYEKTTVPTFLAEMDGVIGSGAIVIGATNRPETIDPAVLRDGRFDYKIEVKRPTQSSATEIASKNFGKTLLDASCFGEKAAESAATFLAERLFSEEYALYEIDRTRKGATESVLFGLKHVVNGAMVVGIVEKAKTHAIDRDRTAGGEPSGINKDDILYAIDRTRRENRDVDVTGEIEDFVRDFRDEVAGVRKLRQASS